jgi:hypothetical protein
MAITRWARRAVLTATALAFALPFSTGTAQADPIIEALADNNVNLTVGAYNNNVNSIPVSLGAGASLNTGSGITLDTNEGIQLALDIGHAEVWADASVGVPFTDMNVGAAVVAAVEVPAVHVMTDGDGTNDTAVAIAAPPPAEPEVAAPPAPEATELVQTAVTITEDTAAVTEEPKGDDWEDDCPEEVRPHGCPNVTALGILSVCLLPNLVQLHI